MVKPLVFISSDSKILLFLVKQASKESQACFICVEDDNHGEALQACVCLSVCLSVDLRTKYSPTHTHTETFPYWY